MRPIMLDALRIAAKPRGRRPTLLVPIKLIHTLLWFSIESCLAYVLWAGFTSGLTAAWRSPGRGRRREPDLRRESIPVPAHPDRRAHRRRAPSVTDIYLPRWLARNLPVIHIPLIVLAGYLHARNLGSPSRLGEATAPAATRHRVSTEQQCGVDPDELVSGPT
jgi:hypothetical protein